MTLVDHCHSRISLYSVGHQQVTQFGHRAVSSDPGQPEKAFTTGTSSSDARRTVLFHVSCEELAIAGSGCNGLPCWLRPLMIMPRDSTAERSARRAGSSSSSTSGSQCALPG